jgi:regulator of sigma E protease
MIEVERDGERLAWSPRRSKDPATRAGSWASPLPVRRRPTTPLQRYGPLAAIPAALRETGKLASDSLGMMRRLVTGQASVKNVFRPGHHRPRRQCLGQARRTGSCISSPCSR